MGKFYGKIGFAETRETAPGIYTEEIVERNYYGDISRMTRRWAGTDRLNDNLEIANELSVISDSFAMENLHLMRYVEWFGSRWKISSVEVQYPRINITTGGVYNGQP